MPLVGLEPTSSSPEKQGFSAGRGTDSGTVTDAGKAGDSKEDRWRCFSIRVVKDREFKLASFKWLKEESVEDADNLPEPEELATDAIAELEGAVEELTAVLTLLENGGKL
jgi:type I restriction enzyme M protein